MFWQHGQGRTAALAVAGVTLLAAGYLLYDMICNQPTKPDTQRGQRKKVPMNPSVSGTRKSVLKDDAVNSNSGGNQPSGRRVHSEPIYLKRRTSISSPLAPPLGPRLAPPLVSLSRSYDTDSLSSKTITRASSEASVSSQSSDADFETDELANFREVIQSTDFQKLEAVALRIRKEVQETSRMSADDEYHLPQDLSCEIDLDPCHGAFNLVYIILFSDGVRWVARIPGHGKNLSNLDKAKMKSEYETTKLIKNNTEIPVPEIYYYNLDSSEIGSAFALMNFVHGVPLDKVWDKALTEHERLRVLSDVAKHMSQLQKLRYGKCGALNFPDQQAEPDVGPRIYFLAHHDDTVEKPWGTSSECQPYDTYAEQLRGVWDECEDFHKRAKSDMPILDIAVKSIPDYLDSDCVKALYMPDLNLHNILVDDNSTVIALLDWDMVGIVPTSAGCAKYPPWIIQDWTHPIEFLCDKGVLFNSEDEADAEAKLQAATKQASKYRKYYAGCYQRAAAGHIPDYDSRTTKQSLILGAIESALHHRGERADIVSNLLQHAFGLNLPFTLNDYADAFEADDTTLYDEMLKEAFVKMWDTDVDLRIDEYEKGRI